VCKPQRSSSSNQSDWLFPPLATRDNEKCYSTDTKYAHHDPVLFLEDTAPEVDELLPVAAKNRTSGRCGTNWFRKEENDEKGRSQE